MTTFLPLNTTYWLSVFWLWNTGIEWERSDASSVYRGSSHRELKQNAGIAGIESGFSGPAATTVVHLDWQGLFRIIEII